jgi:acetyl esterase/lipase
MNISLKKPDGIKSVQLKIDCGNNRIPLLVLSPESGAKDAPGVLWIHGGGFITGMKEMVYMSRAVDLVKEFGAVVVSPGYRLAITKPYPAALDDC